FHDAAIDANVSFLDEPLDGPARHGGESSAQKRIEPHGRLGPFDGENFSARGHGNRIQFTAISKIASSTSCSPDRTQSGIVLVLVLVLEITKRPRTRTRTRTRTKLSDIRARLPQSAVKFARENPPKVSAPRVRRAA